MFGMTAATAWELDAERRHELVMAWKAPRSRAVPGPEARPFVSFRRLVSGLRRMAPANWEDLRT